MNEKFLAYFFTFVGVSACCIGVPFLIVFLGGLGLFTWIANNTVALFALALIAAVGYLLHSDRKKRRQFRAGHERAVNPSSVDEAQPSIPRWHHRSPGK